MRGARYRLNPAARVPKRRKRGLEGTDRLIPVEAQARLVDARLRMASVIKRELLDYTANKR